MVPASRPLSVIPESCKIALFVLLMAITQPLSGQGAPPDAVKNPPAFDVAVVQMAPEVLRPFTDGGNLNGDRYSLHQATLTDMIAAAYDVDPSNVQGGPSWLDWNRYEISARAPATTSKSDLRLMLQALLKQRFSLVIRKGEAPMPAFVLKANGAGLKMKEAADKGAEPNCRPVTPPSDPAQGAIRQILVECKNETMGKFADDIHNMAGGYLNKPVVDQTGMTGAYDFSLKWTPRGLLGAAGAEGISVFDAVDRQLGLKLTLETAPRSVLIVEHASESPSDNPSDWEKQLPALPAAQFEVATIRPSKPGTQPQGNVGNGRVDVQGLTVKQIIAFAWDLNPSDSDSFVGAPKWIDDDRFDIVAKISSEESGDGGPRAPQVDAFQLRQMLRALIEDRFKMKDHWEDRPVTAYSFKQMSPKLAKAADSKARTRCDEGPGPGGKDMRLSNPMINRQFYCQNITMKQLGTLLPSLAFGYIYYPVLDDSGLRGSFDLTLSFSSVDRTLAPPPVAKNQPDAASLAADPSGAVSLFDAFKNQLGLRLEKEKRPMPVLVIDQIDERPTEN